MNIEREGRKKRKRTERNQKRSKRGVVPNRLLCGGDFLYSFFHGSSVRSFWNLDCALTLLGSLNQQDVGTWLFLHAWLSGSCVRSGLEACLHRWMEFSHHFHSFSPLCSVQGVNETCGEALCPSRFIVVSSHPLLSRPVLSTYLQSIRLHGNLQSPRIFWYTLSRGRALSSSPQLQSWPWRMRGTIEEVAIEATTIGEIAKIPVATTHLSSTPREVMELPTHVDCKRSPMEKSAKPPASAKAPSVCHSETL